MAMTLQEMLDLLPDNDTGQIGADDLRAIVTDLFGLVETNADSIALNRTDLDSVSAQASQTEAALAQTNANLDAVFGQVQNHEARITTLEGNANVVGQVFAYQWATSPGPGAGRVTADQGWAMGSTVLQVSETTGSGQTLNFVTVDAATKAEVWLIADDGTKFHATITGDSVDQGGYRDVPISVISVTGTPPSNNASLSVLALVVQ